MPKLLLTLILLAAACSPAARSHADANVITLTNATVVAPAELSAPEARAVTMLVEEIEKRTQVRLPVAHVWPKEAVPVIAVGPAAAYPAFAPDYAPTLSRELRSEGYQLRVMQGKQAPVVLIAGHDARGVLFGIGKLLRVLRMEKQSITLSADLNIVSAPRYPLRGHQLGYRPKTNSYDAWTLPMWEQYIRDLAVFGANAIELIPPRSDDDADSPHFPLPPMDMMIGMSKLLDAYGLDVWIWYPAMDPDYSDPKTVDFALKEWGEVFRKLPRIDAVFVPGGDPGHTQPKYLMNLLAKQAPVLHRYHPKAQLWVAPQGFTQAWLDEFLAILNTEHPDWLTGVVFGPQVRIPLPRLRELVPKRYPIRHYPDITHSRECQYPVPNWDVAFA